MLEGRVVWFVFDVRKWLVVVISLVFMVLEILFDVVIDGWVLVLMVSRVM